MKGICLLLSPGGNRSLIRGMSRNVFFLKFSDETNSIWCMQKYFACLVNVHNTIGLSRHEQVYLTRLSFER